MLITVFTPTYNRAHLLPRVYESLCQQTFRDFEWVIVDDGSTDETISVAQCWTNVSSPKGEVGGELFPVRYFRQENGGKHRAINKGVKEARGELFFIVDSDDYLTNNALEIIYLNYNYIRKKEYYCGVCGMRAYPNMERIATNKPFDVLECTAIDFRYKFGIKGDLAEVLRTDILKLYPFPDIDGERFCPEALVWFRIAKAGYKYRFFEENIYICDYLTGGLTANILKIRIKSPQYAMLTYKEIYQSPVTNKRKVEAVILFWRFYFHCNNRKRKNKQNLPIIYAPFGYLLYCWDKYRL